MLNTQPQTLNYFKIKNLVVFPQHGALLKTKFRTSKVGAIPLKFKARKI